MEVKQVKRAAYLFLLLFIAAAISFLYAAVSIRAVDTVSAGKEVGTAEAVREKGGAVKAGPSGVKKIALTFDDGPHPTRTDEILTLLKKYDIKATFFIIGRNAEENPEVLTRVVNDGHEIGNHTYTHPKLKLTSEETLIDEVKKTDETIFNIVGERTKFFRPPEGFCGKTVTSVANKVGYTLILWNVDTLDWTHASASSIESAILDNVSGGDIILCHDYISENSHTAEALEKIIPILLDEGYEFVTVSELLS